MLNFEIQNHLGHDRNQRSNNDNVRNGTTTKRIITEQGTVEIDIPRNRNSKL